jgi:hypothetical protein
MFFIFDNQILFLFTSLLFLLYLFLYCIYLRIEVFIFYDNRRVIRAVSLSLM